MWSIAAIAGTRPEAIKLAPVILALQADPDFDVTVVSTGQHRTMIEDAFGVFGISTNHDLQIMRPDQRLAQLTSAALTSLDELYCRRHFDVTVVQGDTTSTLTGALVSAFHQIPVVHIEAGLRTGERYTPFPEEISRRAISQLTTLHLAPTRRARQNLLAEGIDPSSVVVTGNTVVDALDLILTDQTWRPQPPLDQIDFETHPVVLVTAHRRESWDKGLEQIAQAIAQIADCRPDISVVLALHANPIIRESMVPWVTSRPNVTVTNPIPYRDFVQIMRRSSLILTDSGGIQEEAPTLGRPVILLRNMTERPEAVETGCVRVVGTDTDRIVESVLEFLGEPDIYRSMTTGKNPFGDGRAAARTLASIRCLLGVGPPAVEFG